MSTVEQNDLLVRVQREDFSVDAEIDRVRSRSRRIGGISIFLGTARDHSEKDVTSMGSLLSITRGWPKRSCGRSARER